MPVCAIAGGSTAAGQGASVYAKSWCGLLQTDLTPFGWTQNNAAVGGYATADVITHWSSVSTPTPDVVVLMSTLLNEGIITSGDKAATYNTWLTNTKTIITSTHALGAVLVFASILPNDGYTGAEYPYLLKGLVDLVPFADVVVNTMAPTDNGTGQWKSGLSADGTHPNDTGHAALYTMFSPLVLREGVFQPLPKYQSPAAAFHVGGIW